MDSPMPPGILALMGGPSSTPNWDRRGLPEAQVMRLREVLDLYARPNPFKRGDLLRPRRGLTVTGPGPYIVVEVLPEPTTPSFGHGACCSDERFDMRVACVMPKGDVGMAWASSFRFEPWVESAADDLPRAAAPAEPALT